MNHNLELDKSRLRFLGLRPMRLQLSVVAASFLLLYAPVFASLASIWREQDRLEGFLIPFVSLYLVWLKREELRTLPLKPMPLWGLPMVLLAGVLLVLGTAGGLAILGEFSLIAMLVGLVLLLLGRAFLKALSLPIAYLLFILSIVQDIVDPLHWPLQLLTAKISAEALQILGFAAWVERQYIVLPNVTLEVARACSGAGYLIAIVTIGLPLAYLTLRSGWTRLSLIVSAVAIGVVANWVRVVLIGIWTYSGNAEMLHGPFHILQGIFVAWVGYVALFAGAWGLSKFERPNLENYAVKPSPPGDGDPCDRGEWNAAWRMAMGCLLVSVAYLGGYNHAPVKLKKDFATFPISIGRWTGEQVNLEELLFRVQGADHEIVRTYRDPEGRRFQLYVAYLESQRQGKELVNYETARLHAQAEALEIPMGPKRFLSVNRSRYGGQQNADPILFWYDLNGRVIADRYRAKVATILDALLHSQTNGALVLIAGEPVEGKDGEAQRAQAAFVRDLFGVLRDYLP